MKIFIVAIALQSSPIFMGVAADSISPQIKSWVQDGNVQKPLPSNANLLQIGSNFVIEEKDPFGLQRIDEFIALISGFEEKGITDLKAAPPKLRQMLSRHLAARIGGVNDPDQLKFTLSPVKKLSMENGGKAVTFYLESGANNPKFQPNDQCPTRKALSRSNGEGSSSEGALSNKLSNLRSSIAITFGRGSSPDSYSQLMQDYIAQRNRDLSLKMSAYRSVLAKWLEKSNVPMIEKGASVSQMDAALRKKLERETKFFDRYGFASENEMIQFLSGAKTKESNDYLSLAFKYRQENGLAVVDQAIIRP